MKLKTAALLIFVGIAIIIPTFFITNSHNHEILIQEFLFTGFSFSVIGTMVFLIILAAVIPSIYFTLKYTQLLKHNRSLEKQRGVVDASQQESDEIRLCFFHGRYDRVLELLAERDDPTSLLLRARAHLVLDDAVSAESLLKKAFAENGHVEAGYLLAETLIDRGQSPLDTLNALIHQDGGNTPRAWNLMLRYYDRREMWTECLATLEEIRGRGLDTDPALWPAYRYQVTHSDDGLPHKKAIESYQQILKDAPDFVPANLALADTHMANGSVEKAFRIFEQAFAKTLNPVFLERLEHFYLEQGRPEDAIRIYRELMIKIGGPLIKFQLGKLYFKLEMMDESLEMLEPLGSALDHIPGYLYYLAELKARRQRPEEALDDLRKLVLRYGFSGEDYICTHCRTAYKTWQARCGQCRKWDTITLEAGLVTEEEIPFNPISY